MSRGGLSSRAVRSAARVAAPLSGDPTRQRLQSRERSPAHRSPALKNTGSFRSRAALGLEPHSLEFQPDATV